VRGLIQALSPALHRLEARSGQIFNRTSNDLKHIHSNFKNSCGFELSDFMPIIKSRARQSGVPAEILMSLMTQESSGRCYALNSETDRSQRVGLWQINSTNTKFPRCTNAQKVALKKIGSASRLAGGPRCLENPLINLEEAIRLLNGKKRALTTGRNAFDADKLSQNDLWLLAISAYNGGERWVQQAKTDLERFNAKNGTNLNAHHWEDLRLFYLRRWLDRGTEQQMFGRTASGRSQSNSVANLSYAENIVGRPKTVARRPGLASLWASSVR
jgi:hypothetical protein